jgi:hypothetical protein
MPTEVLPPRRCHVFAFEFDVEPLPNTRVIFITDVTRVVLLQIAKQGFSRPRADIFAAALLPFINTGSIGETWR